MTSGRTSKLIRELDRTLVFGEYVSSECSDEPTAPIIFRRGLMKWGYYEG